MTTCTLRRSSPCGYGTLTDLPSGANSFTTIELKSNFLGTAREGTIACVATRLHSGRTSHGTAVRRNGVRNSQREEDRVVPVHAIDTVSARRVIIGRLYNLSMAGTLSLHEILEILRGQIPRLTERYSVETLEVFGSYVRSEQDPDSDLDILVTFKDVPSLLTFIAIENYLSDLLGIKVDLVMKDSLKPRIGERILREAIPV